MDISRKRTFSIWSMGLYFERYAHGLLCCYCLWASLSIAAAQMILIPLILSWVIHSLESLRRSTVRPGPEVAALAAPIITWIILSFLSSIVGVNPLQALEELGKTTITVLLPFCVYSSLRIYSGTSQQKLGRIILYILLIICSQTLASMHTLIENTFQLAYLPKTPGSLTESGQLVLVVPLLLAFGAIAVCAPANRIDKKPFGRLLTPARIFECSAVLALLMLIAWPHLLALPSQPLQWACSLGLGLYLLFAYRVQPLTLAQISPKGFLGIDRWLQIAGMLMFAALILNLKRGPWMGIAIELVILGAFLSKRLLLLACAGGFLLLLLFEPVHDRVFQIGEHFNIDGGRRYMWSLGTELVQRYPLGIGPDNSKYMQVIDPTLPQPHQHMHNNLLNVLVESGWLGLAAYLWWFFAAIKMGVLLFFQRFRAEDHVSRLSGLLALSLSVSMIGWQVAGFVEYNFGDGEIRLLGLFAMGLLLALSSMGHSNQLNRNIS